MKGVFQGEFLERLWKLWMWFDVSRLILERQIIEWQGK